MRLTKNLLIALLLVLVGSCVKQPDYSIVPHIELIDITFKKGNVNSVPAIPDTLIYRIKFTDGDGDLGTNSSDSSNSIYSYNPWYFVYNTTNFSLLIATDNNSQIPSGYKYINYQTKRTVQQFDTLPPLGCQNWELERDSQGRVSDTVYIQQNLRAYNVNVDVYTKNSSGTYDKFDPSTYFDLRSCAPNVFRSTFPDLSNASSGPLDGVITFRIQSYYLGALLNTKTLKMDITISDRAYHVSNAAEKTDFTLQQITK
jgi:hypothetical protein